MGRPPVLATFCKRLVFVLEHDVAELALACRLGFYFRIVGKQLVHHEALVGGERRHLDIVLKEPGALSQDARLAAHALEL